MGEVLATGMQCFFGSKNAFNVVERQQYDDGSVRNCSVNLTVDGDGSPPVVRLRGHQRNYSDPVNRYCPLFSSGLGTEGKLSSAFELREAPTVSESWADVKRRLLNARLEDREISRDMERENMHFYLSEMLISAIEQMKWQSEVEAVQQKTDNVAEVDSVSSDDLSNSVGLENLAAPLEVSAGEFQAGASTFYTLVEEHDDSRNNHFNQRTRKEDEDEDGDSGCESSAEAIASSLLRHFSAVRPPEMAENIRWLVSFADAPQMLLPMPDGITICADELDEEGRPIRLRGSSSWAPPRKQWIFTLHPPAISFRVLLEQQHFRCAGCGIKIDKVYIRRLRFCDYYGRLFCQRCHQGTKMRIPARILQQWNFREYPVSDVARRFLTDNYSQPVINALAVDPRFYDRFRRLRVIRSLRIKLVHLWSYIRLCRIAEETVTKHGNLRSMFTSVPGHLLCDADVFSMADLENARNGDLIRLIEPLVRYGRYHVESCEYCRAHGFVCELCDRPDDVLFPFELERVNRCDDCGSLSHLKCAVKRNKEGRPCPKCERIAINVERHRRHSTSSVVASPLAN